MFLCLSVHVSACDCKVVTILWCGVVHTCEHLLAVYLLCFLSNSNMIIIIIIITIIIISL